MLILVDAVCHRAVDPWCCRLPPTGIVKRVTHHCPSIDLLVVLALGAGVIAQAREFDNHSARAKASGLWMFVRNILEVGIAQGHAPVIDARRGPEAAW